MKKLIIVLAALTGFHAQADVVFCRGALNAQEIVEVNFKQDSTLEVFRSDVNGAYVSIPAANRTEGGYDEVTLSAKSADGIQDVYVSYFPKTKKGILIVKISGQVAIENLDMTCTEL